MLKKRILATATAVLLLVSAASIPAGAASKTWSLDRSQTESYGYLDNKRTGNVEYIDNHYSSDNGVNIYLDFKIPNKSYQNSHHYFAEPGQRIVPTRYDVNSGNVGTDWRGTLTSWWIGGKNCAATGKFHAF